MFRRPFTFTRKSSDENQGERSQRAGSDSEPITHSSELRDLHREYSTKEQTYLSQTSDLPILDGLKLPHENERRRKSGDHSRRVSEAEAGPLGLTVVYRPEHDHKLDIVFIHGLGGTSHLTWSKNKNLELFWPYKFLSLEPDICQARILTFGYDADFLGTNVSSSVLDFAKDLLFNLKYAKDKDRQDLRLGTVPIIFVVHSMGGLVIKEAYIQGQNDPEYEPIIKSISAITFLATPHRGTNLAEVLKFILQSTFIVSSKRYISELARNSFTLQKLNEQFRHIAPKLHIVSFYETMPTALGPKALAFFKPSTVMILQKDSSLLGYPGEISKAMSADHHNVCKYDSPTDPNYVLVRDVLASLIRRILSSEEQQVSSTSNRRYSHDLKSLLSITELPDADYIFFRDQWAHGTSDWILNEKLYLEWFHPRDTTSSLLWLNGGPAAGKSVMASFIINNLVEQGLCCQYFFIRFGDQQKRNLSFLLRSLAYQLGRSKPIFLEKILSLKNEAIDLETADPRTIWEYVFKSTLLKTGEKQPLYWIIDGIDEATDPGALVKQLSEVASSSTPLRILLVSRKTASTMAAIEKLPNSIYLGSISIEEHVGDLSRYIRKELKMAGSAQYQETVVMQILGRAQNNFLWVRLAVEKMNACHTQADVEIALQELPEGMEGLFHRMASYIAQNPSETDKAFSLSALEVVSCSLRTLTVAELLQAMDKGHSDLLDFQRSIVDLCGGFVVIDNGGNVAMIHQTAREYLLRRNNPSLQIDGVDAHKKMFLSCMRSLMTIGLRSKIQGNQKPDFLDYAASSWSSHLAATTVNDGELDDVLTKFLTGAWVLTWINFLASNKQLGVLVQTSKHLSKYSNKQKTHHAAHNRQHHHVLKQELLESWSIDLVKIVGKFGAILRRDPQSIYKLIPPFCPKNSSIYELFGSSEAKGLAISGLTNENWEDSLARISLEFGTYASSILAAGAQIAILASSGSVFIYDSVTFEECSASPIKHGERIYRMVLNSAGTLLATYGYRTTKIWDVPTGKCRLIMENLEERPRPLAMCLIDDDTALLVGSEDRRLRSLRLNQSSPQWQLVAELEEPELDGHFLNSSSYMALNKDGSLIAVAYRGHPLSAWETEGPVHIGHCWRKRDELARGEVIEAVWHPHDPTVLGLYIEGVVFKWHPFEDEVEEVATGASRLSISRDGNLFATGDVHGKVKVYTTSDFGLLYQLASEDTVLGLAFSPDLRRFYDIRGYFANAWEPNALIRFAEQRGTATNDWNRAGSLAQSSTTFASASGRVDAITTLAGSPMGQLYCCGTDKGTIALYDTRRGKISDIYTSKSFLSIEKLAWSNDGRYIAFSDSSKTVTIMSLSLGADNSFSSTELKAAIPFKTNTNGPISQLLCHPDSGQFSIHSASTIHIVSLTSFSVTRSLVLATTECKWIIHPQDTGLIMGFEPQTIHILDWSLAKLREYKMEQPYSDSPRADLDSFSEELIVDRVLVAHSKKHVLLQTSLRSRSSREKTLVYFPIPSLSPSNTATPVMVNEPVLPTTIHPIPLPRELSSEVALCLSFLPQNRIVFLSKMFSVCTLRIAFNSISSMPSSSHPTIPPIGIASMIQGPSSNLSHDPRRNSSPYKSMDKGVKTLFWLPGDWMNVDCLVLCEVWAAEKSFMCPRNGEVAIVRCAALV